LRGSHFMIEITTEEAQCFYTLLAGAIGETDEYINLCKKAGLSSESLEKDREFFYQIIEKLQPVMNI